jgi:hypothetical protein
MNKYKADYIFSIKFFVVFEAERDLFCLSPHVLLLLVLQNHEEKVQSIQDYFSK